MTVRLRPHHLLCLLTYAGKGYSPAFTANLDAVVRRIASGEAVRIVEGPDDICAPLLDDQQAHCFRDSVTDRDRIAARAVGDLLGRPVVPGECLSLDAGRVGRLRAAYADGHGNATCVDCEWLDVCRSIAADGYRGTIAFAPD